MIVQAEHIIQRHAKLWAREAIAVEFEFFAFDRSAPRGRFTHAREKARGLQANTPDTLLVVGGGLRLWCEFKKPGKKPSDDQFAMGERLILLGDQWFWADSVLDYWAGLRHCGVSLRPNADFLARHHQAAATGAIEAAMLKAGRLPDRLKPSKPRAARPTKAGLRFAAARLAP